MADRPVGARSTSAPSEFGRLLRMHRDAKRWSRERLAAASGMSVNGISALERGINAGAKPENATSLADALGLDAAQKAEFEAAARLATKPETGPGQAGHHSARRYVRAAGAPLALTLLRRCWPEFSWRTVTRRTSTSRRPAVRLPRLPAPRHRRRASRKKTPGPSPLPPSRRSSAHRSTAAGPRPRHSALSACGRCRAPTRVVRSVRARRGRPRRARSGPGRSSKSPAWCSDSAFATAPPRSRVTTRTTAGFSSHPGVTSGKAPASPSG